MFRAHFCIFALILASLATPSSAQKRVESIQEIPYDLLQSYTETNIDFESHTDWTASPRAINNRLVENGIRFATRFDGQVVIAQRSSAQAIPPLALTPLSSFTDAEITAAFLEPDGYRTVPGYIRRSPYLPLVIGGVGRRAANMLSGLSTPASGKVLTSLSPRLQLRSDGTWEDYSVVGIEPIALMFDTDQTAVGFTLVFLNRQSQVRFVPSTMYETLVQVKFFRRDGSLISEVVFSLYQTAQLAFARCGKTTDIAGIQIANSSRTGFAIDDIILGMPQVESQSLPDEGPLSQLDEAPASGNPLQVDLCSFYTS